LLDVVADEIVTGESINYQWFFDRALSEKQLAQEELLDELYDRADRNWRLTFYSWGNYIDYVRGEALEEFVEKFSEFFGKKFDEDAA
jgi:hypothetical protein